MIYPAHIRTDETGTHVQTVQEHCRDTASYSARCLAPVSLVETAALAGLIHDMGKFTAAFKAYLEAAVSGRAVQRGCVIHTHAAVRFLLRRYHTPDGFSDFRDMTAELLAYAAGAHHGLFDCVDERHRSGFAHRVEGEESLYQEAVSGFLAQCAGLEELDARFEKASQELMPIYQWITGQEDAQEHFFYLGLLARLVLSAVIEGDRQDTARYMNRIAPPEFPEEMRPIWERLLSRVEGKLARFPPDTPLQSARQEISRQCGQAGQKPGGVYRLNVPTGAGKTLSSLRFALAHAACYNKSRLIFTSPLLSILEQNASVLRDYLGEEDLILEHHSNVVHCKNDGDELDPHELMAENWNAPVIITTLVQLLNTLFSGKTTCIRRFQALCNCVLVIDEVQTVPARMLTLFNLAVNFLAQVCGATVVLCSATQPCLEAVEHPILGGLEQLVPYDPALWAPFQRTRLTDAGALRLEEIPGFLRQKLEETSSLLVICNNKKEARTLYEQMKGRDVSCFHLSAAMCPAHRRDTLADLEVALSRSREDGSKVLCVSTQVMEAGVDISFGSVIRLTAGMDSIVQSAGRCNRNGEADRPAPVYLLNCCDENLGKLRDIQRAKDATGELLSVFRGDSARFRNDLASDEAISFYYHVLYQGMPKGFRDYSVKGGPTLYDLLSVNDSYAGMDCPEQGKYGLNQAFSLAGRLFQVFDQETTDVLVPYGKGRELILELGAPGLERNPARQKALLEAAKPYTVSLYRFQKDQLEGQRGLDTRLNGSVFILNQDFYDRETGLTPEPGSMNYLEV